MIVINPMFRGGFLELRSSGIARLASLPPEPLSMEALHFGGKAKKGLSAQRNKQFLREFEILQKLERPKIDFIHLTQLLDQGADINTRSWNGSTALHLAAAIGSLALVDFLRSHQAEINLKNNDGHTPLYEAIVHGHFTVVEYLLDHDALVSDKDLKAFLPIQGIDPHQSAQSRLKQMLLNRMKHNVPPDPLISKPILEVVRSQDIPLLRYYLSKGYALPAQVNGLPILDFALKAVPAWPLFQLIYEHQFPKTGPKPSDHELGHLLFLAIELQKEKIFDYLLEQGAPVNMKNEAGETPLTLATRSGVYSFFYKLLVDYKADPNIPAQHGDQHGETPLQIAAKKLFVPMIELLINHQANADVADDAGRSPLLIALLSAMPETNIENRFPEKALTPVETSIFEFKQTLQKILTGNLEERQQLLSAGTGSAIFRLLGHDPAIDHFVGYMIRRNDEYRQKHGEPIDWHPLEAELLGLLAQERTEKSQNILSQAITSIYSFFDVHQIKTISDSVMDSWKKIGILTHRFLAWKYDAVGGRESLLAQYGFRVLEHPRDSQQYGDKSFLKTFTWMETPTHSVVYQVVFRRGYLLISNPKKGTLVIRNSSPAFGRGLMPHTAYYFPKAIWTDAELLTLDPPHDPRFKSALDPSWYKTKDFPYFTEKLTALTQGLMDFTQDYAQWKFNPDPNVAFDAGRFVGYQQKGFQAMIDRLKIIDADRQLWKAMHIASPSQLPDLAFISASASPPAPFAYMDQQGEERIRYSLTPEHLQELEDLAAGKWKAARYPQSDLMRFLQVGLRHWGELIWVDPAAQAAESVFG